MILTAGQIRDRVGRTRILANWAARGTILICEIALGAFAAPPLDLNALPVRQVQAGREWRLAREIPAGEGIETDLGTLHERDLLRLGLLGTADTGVRIQVRAGDRVLWEQTFALNAKWQDARAVLEGHGSAGQVARIVFSSSVPFQIAPCELAVSDAAKPNILIYLIDALRLDHLGCYGYARNTSPNIDAFAKESVRFTQLVPQSSWTRPSVATYLTSTYPAEHGAISYTAHIRAAAPRLAECLRRAGYETHGVITNPHTLPEWGFAEGFSRYLDVEALNAQMMDPIETVRAAIDTVQGCVDRPWFLFVHTKGVHAAYLSPEPYWSQFKTSDLPGSREDIQAFLDSCPETDHIYYHLFGMVPGAPAAGSKRRSFEEIKTVFKPLAVDAYDGAIAYNDQIFREMLDALKKAGMYENTVIVLISDHGEEFWDHGGLTHGNTLYEEMLRVPLLIKLPRHASAGTVCDSLVEGVDVAPTLAALGEATPDTHFRGRSMLPLLREAPREDRIGFACLSLGSGYDPGWIRMAKTPRLKYLGNARESLDLWFDLVHDPREESPLARAPGSDTRVKAWAQQLAGEGAAGFHLLVRCALQGNQVFTGVLQTQSPFTFELAHSDGVGEARQAGDAITFRVEMKDVVPNVLEQVRTDGTPTDVLAEMLEKFPWQNIHLTVRPPAGAPVALKFEADGAAVAAEHVQAGPNRLAVPLDGSPLRLADLTTGPDTYSHVPDAFGVYVWYVPDVEQQTPDQLDPTMREALEAAGYLFGDPSGTPACDRLQNALSRTAQGPALVDQWREYLREHPNASRAHYWLGIALEKNGQESEARAAFNEALKLGAQETPFKIDLAEALARCNDPAAAAAALKDVPALGTPGEPLRIQLMKVAQSAMAKPSNDTALAVVCRDLLGVIKDDPRCTVVAGRLAEHVGDLAGAVEYFRVSSEATPNDPATLVLLGLALRANDEPDKAVEAFDKALQIDPANEPALQGKAEAARKQGDWAAAAQIGQRLCELKPGDADALAAYGDALEQAGRPKEALAAYEAALAINPALVPALIGAGLVHQADGDLGGALKSYQKACDAAPNDAYVLYLEAVVLQKQNNVKAATIEFRRALEIRPDDVSALIGLGQCLREQQDLSRGIAVLRKAVELDPGNASAQFGLGAALRDNGDLDGAMRAFEKAREAKPDDINALLGQGEVQEKAGDVTAAVATYKQAISEHPDSAAAYLALGRVLESVHQYSDAASAYRKAAELEPGKVDAWMAQGAVLEQEGDAAGAVAAYRKAVEVAPDQARFRLALGRVLQQLGDAPGALDAFRQVQQLDPQSAEAFVSEGLVCKAQNDIDGAAAAFRKAVALRPEDAYVQLCLGESLAAKGENAEALKAFRKAGELDTDHVWALTNEARLLARQGDLDEAVAAYRKAAERSGDDPDVQAALGNALSDKGDLAEALNAYRRTIEIHPAHVAALGGECTALGKLGDLTGLMAAVRRPAPALDEKSRADFEAYRAALVKTLVDVGSQQARQGDPSAGIQAVQEAIDAAPNDPMGYNVLAGMLAASGDESRRLEIWQDVVRRHAEVAAPRFHLARALVEASHLDEAAEAYQQAADLDADYRIPSAQALGQIGAALKDQGHVDAAIERERQAAALNPQDAWIQAHLGAAYEEKGDLDAAAQAYRQAIALDPRVALAYYGLDSVFDKQAQPEARVAEWRRMAAEHPDVGQAVLHLAMALEAAGDVPGAAATYQQAVAIEAPLAAQAVPRLSRIARQLGGTQATELYRAALALVPNDATLKTEYARSLAASGDFEGAVRLCREAIGLAPDSQAAYQALDAVLTARKDPAARVTQWQALVQEQPNRVGAHWHLGLALEAQGDKGTAASAFRKAADLAPVDPAIQANAGLALVRLGDFAGAAQRLQTALSVNPNLPELRPELVRALCESKQYDAAWNEAGQCKQRGVDLPQALLDRLAQDSGKKPE